MTSISIIVPVYLKSEEEVEWLSELIESIKGQSFSDFEVLLIDDGSPFEPNFNDIDDRFSYHKLGENYGPAVARNTGAYIAESEALLCLDSDDIIPLNTLELMYNEWVKDKSKIIYGNIQRIERIGGKFEETKFFDMPHYTFSLLLELTGAIPVSCLHSYDCHVAAGGWKPEIYYGLEDLEYWIAAGKLGYCGQKIDALTLYYRKHKQSRSYKLRYESKEEAAMRDLIKTIHSDVYYEGVSPMACNGCGDSNNDVLNAETKMNTMSFQIDPSVSELDKYPESDLVLIKYNGSRKASFKLRGSYTNVQYEVKGQGSIFLAHKMDAPKIRSLGRGIEYTIEQREVQIASKQSAPRITRYNPEAPKIAQTVRPSSLSEKRNPTLEDLNVGDILVEKLQADNWSLEALSMIEDPSILRKYDGVGEVRSKAIVSRARELLGDIIIEGV